MTLLANLSPTGRRIVALSLATMGMLVFFDVAIMPIVGTFLRQQERIAELESQYIRFAQVADRRDVFKAREISLQADQGWRRQFLAAPSEPDAGTVLQRRIRDAADRAEIQVQSFEPISGQAVQGFTKLGVKLELQAAADALSNFLEALRDAPELIIIENVSIRAMGNNAGAKLQVRAELSGYWRPIEPPQ